MLLIVEDINISGIPSIQVVEKGRENKPLPLLIFWHGWTSIKEMNLRYAYVTAKNGYRVVLPDSIGHGERLNELSKEERVFGFWPVVLNNIKETNKIKLFFEEKGLILDQRIALAGSSMGAITTLGSLVAYDWVKVAVSFMGSPYYQKFFDHLISGYRGAGVDIPFSDGEITEVLSQVEPYDLSQNIDRLQGRPLLFWHGKKDPTVPYEQARQFYDQLVEKGLDTNIEFITDDQGQHKVPASGGYILNDWLTKHL